MLETQTYLSTRAGVNIHVKSDRATEVSTELQATMIGIITTATTAKVITKGGQDTWLAAKTLVLQMRGKQAPEPTA